MVGGEQTFHSHLWKLNLKLKGTIKLANSILSYCLKAKCKPKILKPTNMEYFFEVLKHLLELMFLDPKSFLRPAKYFVLSNMDLIATGRILLLC